jgi:C-terminal processing protease CtpA/Prc
MIKYWPNAYKLKLHALTLSGLKLVLASGLAGVLLTGCGSSGSTGGSNSSTTINLPPFVFSSSGSNSSSASTPPATTWQAGSYAPSSSFANFCATPRRGTHPFTGVAFPDKQGSVATENHFLRSWSYEDYLWYRELPDLDPNNYSDTLSYFELLKTNQLTATNTIKDQFHFTDDEISNDQFVLTGERGGYGLAIEITDNNQVFVIYVEPNSPAELAGISRGMRLTQVNGISLLSELTLTQANAVNEALFFPELNSTASLVFSLPLGGSITRQLQAINVATSAVLERSFIDTAFGNVGYLAFNTFNTFTAEDELKEAFDYFNINSVVDLVVDLRYNGGGFIHIASQLAYLVAGNSATSGETFTQLRYNDKSQASNLTLPFYSTTTDFAAIPNQQLNSVDLNRVFVLTTSNTCSASENFINGLRGIGVEVFQIGSTTCGKPYGFNPQANCGTLYFSTNFESVNAQGFGGYYEGFEPVLSGGNPLSNQIDGCDVMDDLGHELGDRNEAMLSAALFYRENARCPVGTLGSQKSGAALLINGTTIAPPAQKVMRTAPLLTP